MPCLRSETSSLLSVGREHCRVFRGGQLQILGGLGKTEGDAAIKGHESRLPSSRKGQVAGGQIEGLSRTSGPVASLQKLALDLAKPGRSSAYCCHALLLGPLGRELC